MAMGVYMSVQHWEKAPPQTSTELSEKVHLHFAHVVYYDPLKPELLQIGFHTP